MYRRRASIADYYRDALDKLRSLILRESEAQIIGSDTTELAEYYFQQYALNPIEIDDTREKHWEYNNYVKTIPANQRESFYGNEGNLDFPCERILVEIPIKPNDNIKILSELTSSTFSDSYPEREFNWNQNSISFVIETKGYGFSLDEERIANEINDHIRRVTELLEWKNNDIKRGNVNLLNGIKGLIDVRKQNIQKSKDKIQSLTQKINIPLKKNIPQGAQRIALDPKPIVKRIKPNPHLPEEYVLDESKVNDILEVLDNQAKSFERTPKALASLGEEELRDLLLANLNSIFEGKATGETFSKKGKTDIYLNINKGNILVFECKQWGGKKLLHETIDQLRGYLTWRHNYGVIIIFSKIKNFSKIFSEIPSTIQESQSFKNSYKKINETHYSAIHVLEDDGKEVKIHYLFYNLFSEN
ncbi:MAG: hypothetical protein A2Z52_00425 [Candidatus Moranbacteria bacterium RBG_19FT_COMBO_42_6]|nr:MAG: hypothetical protein A2Z52_00425 [Candidatus Moranbacteria bacterium RBG_19FT_COMBO_42_6]